MSIQYAPGVHYFVRHCEIDSCAIVFRSTDLTEDEAQLLCEALERYEHNSGETRVAFTAVSAASDPAAYLEYDYDWKYFEEWGWESYVGFEELDSLGNVAYGFYETLIALRENRTSKSFLTADVGSGEFEVFNCIEGLTADEFDAIDEVLSEEIYYSHGFYERYGEFELRAEPAKWLKLNSQWEVFRELIESGKLSEFERWAINRSNALAANVLALRKLPKPASVENGNPVDKKAGGLRDSNDDIETQASLPEWNAELGELRFRGKLVRKVRPLARNVMMILSAFQELKWCRRVDDPLPGGRNDERLRGAIRSLNDGMQLLVFESDGSGTGIRWRTRQEINASEADA